MKIYQCDWCSKQKPCTQMYVNYKYYDFCKECREKIEKKLEGKGESGYTWQQFPITPTVTPNITPVSPIWPNLWPSTICDGTLRVVNINENKANTMTSGPVHITNTVSMNALMR